MLILVTGAASSGKSEIAENVAMEVYSYSTPKGGLYYVACMHVQHQEDEKRVERHRKLRLGKGFTTLEKFTDIRDITIEEGDTILVECMSNLLANEMFDSHSHNWAKPYEQDMLCEKIVSDIIFIEKKCVGVVVVTNEVFSDGYRYDEDCMRYLKCLGQINTGLAKVADQVIESVAGIPVILK